MVLLDLPATAHVYHVPLSTLRRWLAEGKLTRHGSKPYRVDLEEVEALLDRRGKLPKLGQ